MLKNTFIKLIATFVEHASTHAIQEKDNTFQEAIDHCLASTNHLPNDEITSEIFDSLMSELESNDSLLIKELIVCLRMTVSFNPSENPAKNLTDNPQTKTRKTQLINLLSYDPRPLFERIEDLQKILLYKPTIDTIERRSAAFAAGKRVLFSRLKQKKQDGLKNDIWLFADNDQKTITLDRETSLPIIYHPSQLKKKPYEYVYAYSLGVFELLKSFEQPRDPTEKKPAYLRNYTFDFFYQAKTNGSLPIPHQNDTVSKKAKAPRVEKIAIKQEIEHATPTKKPKYIENEPQTDITQNEPLNYSQYAQTPPPPEKNLTIYSSSAPSAPPVPIIYYIASPIMFFQPPHTTMISNSLHQEPEQNINPNILYFSPKQNS